MNEIFHLIHLLNKLIMRRNDFIIIRWMNCLNSLTVT